MSQIHRLNIGAIGGIRTATLSCFFLAAILLLLGSTSSLAQQREFGEPLLAGFSTRDVFYLVAGAVVLSLLAASTAFALFLALRRRRSRDALAQTIIERNRAEAMLGEKEQRHAGILDIAQEAIISIDADHRIETFNQGAEHIFGYSADEVLGQSLEVLIPSQFRAAHDAHIEGFRREPGVSRQMRDRGEILGLRKDGTEFPAEASISKLSNGDQTVFSVVLRDITEQKRIETELREREELYRVTFESAAIGIVHVSPDGRILRANQKICDILGYERDELVRLSHRDVTVPDDRADDLEMVRKLLAGEISSGSREKRYYRKDGSIVWVNLTIALVRDDAGEPDHFISIIEDITGRKELEATLHRSALAIDGISEEITLYDSSDRLVQVNRGFVDAYPHAENSIALGMTFEEVIRAMVATGALSEAVGREEEWLAERLEKHRNPSGPFEVARADGSWILVSDHRLPDGGHLSISLDITEQKRIEAELREREELYRVTFKLAAVGVAHVSPEGEILRANQKLCDILGYDSDEILGLPHQRITFPDDKDKDSDATNKLLTGEISSSSREKRYIRKDGSIIWAGLTVALVRDASGEPDYFISIIEDITERKELEAELQRSAMAINSASETITLFDADDRMVQLNRGFGNDHPDFKNTISLGMTFEDIMRAIVATGSVLEADGREEEWLAERLEKHRNPGAPFEIAIEDGLWILVSEHRLPDGGTISIASDITEFKQAEEVVRSSEQRLNAIIGHHRDAIVIVDEDGLIRFANSAAELILGRKAEDLIDSPFGIPLVGGEIIEVEIAGRNLRIAEMQAVPFNWEDAGARLVTLRDITERKRTESNAQQLRSQLAHAARVSTVSDLAAGLAHEINQPLTAINNYIQTSVRLLRSDKARAEDVVGDLEKAARQVLRAGDIVTWLRGAVKKEEGQKIDLDLVATIEEVADFLDAEIRARNAELSLDFPDSIPPVFGDKVQIQQVVLNLIQNSLEEAQRDTNIRHEITVRAWETTDGSVVTEISDNGPGVPSERQNELFSAFYTTKTDGLGLGLSISKSIVEDHGGRIWLVSEGERGATFAFTLQIAEDAASSAKRMANASD